MRIDHQFETLTVARSLDAGGPRELCLLWSVAVARLCVEETPRRIVAGSVADQYGRLLDEIEQLELGPWDDERVRALLDAIDAEPASDGPGPEAAIRTALRTIVSRISAYGGEPLQLLLWAALEHAAALEEDRAAAAGATFDRDAARLAAFRRLVRIAGIRNQL